MQDKAVTIFTAAGILLCGAVSVGTAFQKVVAEQAPAPAPIESKFGPEEGPLTMKQRAARANHHNLQAKCASHLSDSLKDPNSMRIIDGSYGARGDRKIVINLTYTATNSFGGRVKEQNFCTYTL
jgi:hypothetical protein